MELPEEDKQALIEAARRRGVTGSGGAAFGVMPSSGKRPKEPEFPPGSSVLDVPIGGKDRLTDTVLRRRPEPEASMTEYRPSMAQRHAAGLTKYLTPKVGGPKARAVSQSLLGGQESVLPFGIGLQEFVPFSPYVAEEAGAMVREGQETDSPLTTGLGVGLGALQAFPAAKPLARGAKAAGKALGPKAAQMAEGYLQSSGLAPAIIKPKGGNWLAGDVEKQTGRLKLSDQMEPQWYEDRQRWLEEAQAKGDERAVRAITGDVEIGRRNDALGNWIDKKLNKYIRNEMGTMEDPLRALAERDVLHYEPQQVFGDAPSTLMRKRMGAGMPTPLFGKSEMARRWEALADRAIDPYPAGSYKYGSLDESFLTSNPWLEKVPDEAMVYKAKGLQRDMGFDHLVDELRNAIRPDSDLPAHLRWKPEDLTKVTVPQAVERVAKINEWRAAQMEAARKAAREGIPLHKEYEGGYQWMAAPDTETNPKSLQYIKDVGCESGWCTQGEETAKRYGGGGNQLYVLHDPEGKSVVQISVKPGRPWNQRSGVFYEYPELEKPWAEFSKEINTAARAKGVDRNPNYIVEFPDWLAQNQPEVFAKHKNIFEKPPAEIVEIKGRQNRPPKEEHLPMVQDFVRSGKWGSVGDLKNTGLYRKGDFIDEFTSDQLDSIGKGEYLTMDEIKKLREGKAWKPIDTDADWGDVNIDLPPRAMAQGGFVQNTDAIAKQLTGMPEDKALLMAMRMAQAKEEAHMAGGGLAKLLKGAAKAEPAKQIGNYQALPLKLPRAPNLPPQELTKTAERVARQQMGEHVRKSPTDAKNLAGRSMKEAQGLKQLDIEIQPTKEIPAPTVVPEKAGQVRVGLPGDISVADQMLMSVDNLPVGSQQEGGALFGFGKMDLENPSFWASNEGPAQQVQNKVTDVANVFDTPDVIAMHLAMGHDAMNFAQHFADANLLAIQNMPVSSESARMFNEIVRAGNPQTGQKFPNFPGIENYKEAYEAMQKNPEMRKWFNNRMKVDSITQPLGLPSGKQIEYAIMEPELRNMEHSLVGLSVGRMKPGASLMPGSEHKTYSHDIPGLALGRTQELLPVDLAFPDASAYIRSTQRPQDFTGTIQKVFPHQVVDEQYINQLGEYYNRLKQIRGYKKGGSVKKTGLSVLNKAII